MHRCPFLSLRRLSVATKQIQLNGRIMSRLTFEKFSDRVADDKNLLHDLVRDMDSMEPVCRKLIAPHILKQHRPLFGKTWAIQAGSLVRLLVAAKKDPTELLDLTKGHPPRLNDRHLSIQHDLLNSVRRVLPSEIQYFVSYTWGQKHWPLSEDQELVFKALLKSLPPDALVWWDWLCSPQWFPEMLEFESPNMIAAARSATKTVWIGTTEELLLYEVYKDDVFRQLQRLGKIYPDGLPCDWTDVECFSTALHVDNPPDPDCRHYLSVAQAASSATNYHTRGWTIAERSAAKIFVTALHEIAHSSVWRARFPYIPRQQGLKPPSWLGKILSQVTPLTGPASLWREDWVTYRSENVHIQADASAEDRAKAEAIKARALAACVDLLLNYGSLSLPGTPRLSVIGFLKEKRSLVALTSPRTWALDFLWRVQKPKSREPPPISPSNVPWRCDTHIVAFKSKGSEKYIWEFPDLDMCGACSPYRGQSIFRALLRHEELSTTMNLNLAQETLKPEFLEMAGWKPLGQGRYEGTTEFRFPNDEDSVTLRLLLEIEEIENRPVVKQVTISRVHKSDVENLSDSH